MAPVDEPVRPSNETLPLMEIPLRWAEQWQDGQTPSLDDYLRSFPYLPVRVLVKLVRIDQRKRWKRGEQVPSEDYLARFPVIREDEATEVKADVHPDEDALAGAKRWEELEEHQREGWKKKLAEAGHWAVEEGEAILKGVFFAELGAAVEGAVGA